VRARLIGASLVVSASALIADQAPVERQTPPALFRRTVDVVHLDVSVLDGDRRPIRGLTPADFAVLEDGKPQPIVAFEEVSVPPPGDDRAGWVRDVASDVVTNDLQARRVIVIVFDDAHIPADPGTIRTAKRIASDVVAALGPDDLAAVTFTWAGRKQDVTADRQRLLTSIESLTPHPNLTTPRLGGIVARGPAGPPPCFYRGRYRSVAGCALDTLTNAAEALATAPAGRKTIVYISNGVPFDFSADSDDSTAEFAGVRDLLRSLQRANAAVYTLDPAGLNSPNTTPYADATRRAESLLVLAENTGGRAALNSNAPWGAVPQIFRENSAYYLIGFEPADPVADGRFRSVRVRVNRPGAEARARSGYFAPAPEAPSQRAIAAAPASPSEKALGGALPGGLLKLRATAVAAFAPGARDSVIVIAIGLRQPPAGQAVSRSVQTMATALDQDSKPRGTAKASVQMSFPASRGRDFHYDVVSAMVTTPGRYQLRIGAEVAGETGSVFVDVDVPDFARADLSLSGLLFSAAPAVPSAVSPDLAPVIPVTPTTVRQFGAGDRVRAFVQVVQGGSKPAMPVRVAASILDSNDQSRASTMTELEAGQFTGRTAAYVYDLPIATLAPGEYLLTIEATLGARSVRRTSRFTVVGKQN
jgi:VWFA-related protein